jgi:hypothetical protein
LSFWLFFSSEFECRVESKKCGFLPFFNLASAKKTAAKFSKSTHPDLKLYSPFQGVVAKEMDRKISSFNWKV